ncbi:MULTISPECIES: SDR family NAD(P)-dependent oxidoreductase [unclassified Nocardioides]|uniref:SDR family NAD(P)-dependent oxidoreductase n=1 Tax=unclassified Nocardioides TaxID=2615069 RepID=UPI001A988C31|nr:MULTISPECIES: SDR family oxidoreductase [unclassified Nocardioides]
MAPEFRADGVRVLVTGGTSGLGHAMAAALIEAGAHVAITGRDPARTADAAARLAADGGVEDTRVVGVAMDVRDEESVERGVEETVRAFGGIDVVVNNAGIGMRTVNPRFLTDPQPFWQVSPPGFRDLVATNLTGYFLVARAVVPRMLSAGRGRIVNVTMNHSTMVRRGFVPYGPARAGAEALARIMAADLADTPITVNQVLPGGATESGMIPEDLPLEAREGLLPADVMAGPIRWLCSPEAAGVHDERIVATEFASWLASRSAR